MWCVAAEEQVAFEVKPDVHIERLPRDADASELLAAGAVDAVIALHPPPSITSGRLPVRRLFEESERGELLTRLFPDHACGGA